MKLKIHNTNIQISYTLICVCAICLVTNAFVGFVTCFLSVLIHEAGHLIPIALFGDFPREIKISLFEITISDNNRNSRTLFQNIIIIFFDLLLILFVLLSVICYTYSITIYFSLFQ